ncbi:hypothetical protein [Mucilaginibacter ginkgonis]|uniref:Outer membrane protein with beta-barrel domain n=1 Tax=Mucilaginibacter ginkgonis TaxID=2682091 RepID=A0A6I4I162_9SPHI|nr:hypothetical protein [Mucilaginibacter ginkgonis]QQL51301.1 hypothetical protein GO620_007605 [Mucilaginibacter ginkgonis]
MNFKNSTKLALTSLAFAGLLFAGKANAQEKKGLASGSDSQGFRIGIGVEPGIPTGDRIRPYSHFALGGNLRAQYDLKGPVSLMLTAGYTNFFGRDYTSSATIGGTTVTSTTKAPDYGLIPVKAGIKIFPAHNFYFSGEAGVGFETNNNYENAGNKSAKLILAPGLGFAESYTGLDIGLRYENYSGGNSGTFGQVALRVAYGFGN